MLTLSDSRSLPLVTRTPTPVLLLGASGFLGRHIHAALSGAGIPVRGPDINLAALPPSGWDALLDGMGAVVNAAGRTTGGLSDLVNPNVVLVAQALEAAQRAGVRLLHLASAAEYGRTEEGHASHEDDVARPLSAYGASKLAATVMTEEAARSGRVNALALRVTNPIGAGMPPSGLPGRAAQELCSAVAQSRESVRFGPLGARRDLIAAHDVARAVLHLLPGAPGAALTGTLNVGSGEAVAVRQIVQTLAALVGFAGAIEEDAPGSPRSGDVPYQRADITRLTRSGFVPEWTLEHALQALLHPPSIQPPRIFLT
ncbi:NAD-dependent epimerase/dehydratase family protein [Deinococcus aquatilis]|uniref:NAD-dependent epimerase/dehydratase family protein n=1 Tax=Deinococcus aquatilis TaxID=519440 RepID=UPI00036451FD